MQSQHETTTDARSTADDRDEKGWRDEDRLRELYVEKGLTVFEVGDRLGCSGSTVSEWLRKLGVERAEDPWKNEDKLRELYLNEELTVFEVGDRLGCSGSAISTWLRKFDIERRGVLPDNHPVKDASVLRELYCEKGLSLRKVARELGCENTTVRKYLKKNGLETRSKSEANSADVAGFRTNESGYEEWYSNGDHLRVHRLLAIAEGEDPHEVFGGIRQHIHHENGIQWDNRPDNIELVDAAEHRLIHHGHSRNPPWKDKERLSKTYEHATIQEIADRWGCSYTAIRNAMVEFGIERRTGGASAPGRGICAECAFETVEDDR